MGAGADSESLLLHASCVTLDNHAVLITGASGSGKSTLALSLMAYGCGLVSDDQTRLTRRADSLIASAPETIRGQIEARGVGILMAEAAPEARIAFAVDLDHAEENRLPLHRSVTYLGVSVLVYYVSGNAGFAAALLQLLKTGGQRV